MTDNSAVYDPRGFLEKVPAIKALKALAATALVKLAAAIEDPHPTIKRAVDLDAAVRAFKDACDPAIILALIAALEAQEQFVADMVADM